MAYMEDDAGLARYGRLYQQTINGLMAGDFRSKHIRSVSKARGVRV
jgi:hypothetical protein